MKAIISILGIFIIYLPTPYKPLQNDNQNNIVETPLKKKVILIKRKKENIDVT